MAGSEKGLNTIKKYRLKTELLDMKRSKWLNKHLKEVTDFQRCMIDDGRHETTDEERKKLLRFMSPDQPYSFMSEMYRKNHFVRLIA